MFIATMLLTASISAGQDPKPSAETSAPASEEKPAEVKYLVERLLEGSPAGQTLASNGIKIYGWTGMNYSGSSDSRSNGPVTFNDRANYFQMNQNWLEMSKAIDTSKNEVQFGGKVSMILPGYDYKYTVARGFLDGQFPNTYGFDVVYHYGEVFLPGVGGQGTTFRVGRWATSIGYEQIDTVNTPFLTKSYVFQYDPFTHTGAQATTQLNDDWSVYNGFVTGADVYFDQAGTFTYLGGLKWAPKEGKTTIALNAMINNAKYNTSQMFANYNSYNITATHKFSDKLTYVLDSTYSFMRDVPGVGNAHWYGFSNYYLYQATDKLASNFRWELFDDVQGVRTGTSGLYFEMTYGLTYMPVESVLIRPFVRYDHNKNGAFEGNENLYTGGMELIFRW